jgi:hypothetical protein
MKNIGYILLLFFCATQSAKAQYKLERQHGLLNISGPCEN